jgi:hypothetical protein
LKHDSVIELGLCQIQVIDHQHLASARDLQQLLALDDVSEQAGLQFNDSAGGTSLTIGTPPIMLAKTTFEDMGLGVHFDEKQFFNEAQSESAHIRIMQTTVKKESLDILDQLAIESELAIINPALLNKNVDYWQDAQRNNDAPTGHVAELEYLFALKDNVEEQMVPLDNLEHIDTLLLNRENIDQMIERLDRVDDYALFKPERRVDPLRLFSLENHDIREYTPYSTPEFTQKEHHTTSMDAYFHSPIVPKSKLEPKSKPDASMTSNSAQPVVDDDWLNSFGAPLDRKVLSDDILDSFTDRSRPK